MINREELAEALNGCKIVLGYHNIETGASAQHTWTICEVIPPPKKPEVHCAGWSGERSNGSPLYAPWVLEADFSKSIYHHWLRRETIDGVIQRPTVVSAEDAK